MTSNHPIIMKGVKEVFFSLNEELYIPDPAQIIKIELYHNIGVNTEVRHVKFMAGTFIHYIDSEKKLAVLELNNFFELPRMNEYELADNNVILPGEVLLAMVRESISHLRALFCIKLSGTPYGSIVIPMEDPEKITNHFFPSLIRNPEGELSLKGVLAD